MIKSGPSDHTWVKKFRIAVDTNLFDTKRRWFVTFLIDYTGRIIYSQLGTLFPYINFVRTLVLRTRIQLIRTLLSCYYWQYEKKW